MQPSDLPPPTELQATLDRLVADGLAAPGCRPVPLTGGVDNHAFRVEGANGRELIVKVPVPGRIPRYAIAAWAATELAAANVPVPVSLWQTDDFAVETLCPGRPLGSTTDRAVAVRAAEQAGMILRRIHSVPVTGYGRLRADGSVEHTSIEAWLLRTPSQDSGHGLLHALTPVVTTALRVRAPLVAGVSARLLHGDWTARHVLHTDTTITGVIDLESVRGGDPLADVAGWSLQEPGYLTEALASTYFTHPPEKHQRTVLAVYRVRIALFLLAFHASRGQEDLVTLRGHQIAADLQDLAAGQPRLVPRILQLSATRTSPGPQGVPR
ncbi:aminoglycoside phosphotransferase family protein [Streptomyces sp. NPDC048420]|uniref:aminoglycoside phosphotransferase family protein n=1 Tax=Streptomyces sp. NPDC048420 TaxID=3155755 RepID=UPI0034128DA3